ncbi:chemotaxis protein CheR [Pandoraea thiooxydans]|uniref:CheR family methyltransferase n=1 Tax=Pandoraea thiooxydans TaxID=445709 RepID=UPI00094A493E|nr:CheR family methyltransferase [Pandoraea thiooxydans]APR97430.1 chemotaxis protein CheR [Pandoraea thiooxydans]
MSSPRNPPLSSPPPGLPASARPARTAGGDSVPALDSGRDFVFTVADFARIRDMIYQRAGIALAEHKREMVYSRLARRMRALGLMRFSDYLDRLEAERDSGEWEAFTNALTTNLTSFFREAHHFPLLAEFARSRARPLSIWCCASSTGEEPYSIAMTLLDALGPRAQASVLATDVDTQVLARGAAGTYAAEQGGKLPPEYLRRFFLRGTGANAGKIKVRPEVAALVSFAQLNLLAPQWPAQGPYDAIFCRNVMIYFDKTTQRRILERFAPLLKPGGLLFAGHSENFTYVTQQFHLRGQTVYELARAEERAP